MVAPRVFSIVAVVALLCGELPLCTGVVSGQEPFTAYRAFPNRRPSTGHSVTFEAVETGPFDQAADGANSPQWLSEEEYAERERSGRSFETTSVESPVSYTAVDPAFAGGPMSVDPGLVDAPIDTSGPYLPSEFASPTAPWSPIRLNTAVTEPLLDFQNRQTGKQLLVLESARHAGCEPSVTVGAQFRASALAAYTNRANRFSYLGRFPPDFEGNTASDVRLLQANQAIVAHVAPWASGYFETLFSDVFSFQTFEQGSWQVRQAYVVLGDLNRTPWYGWIGKKTLDFGDLGTLSPFTQAVPWHYFAPLAEGAGVGYSNGRVHLTAAAVNGGRGIRVADSEGFGDIENFVLNSRVLFPLGPGANLTLGAGYIYGTIYDSTVAEHTNPRITGPRNGAIDVNGRLDWGPISLAGEFITTEDPWPAVGHAVQAWKAEGAYRLQQFGRPATLSVSYSEGIQGPAGSEFEFNRQFVLGARLDFTPNIYGTLEWVRSTGFAPLINITTVSDSSVIQDSAVLGLVIAI